MPKSARAAYRRSKASLDKNQSLASYRTPRHPERRRPAKCRDQHFVRITSDGAIGLNRADIGSAGITFVALFSVWTLRALRAGLSLRSKSALYTPVPTVLDSLLGSLPQPARAKTRLTATIGKILMRCALRSTTGDCRLYVFRWPEAPEPLCYAES
jgi:hypothetical protein